MMKVFKFDGTGKVSRFKEKWLGIKFGTDKTSKNKNNLTYETDFKVDHFFDLMNTNDYSAFLKYLANDDPDKIEKNHNDDNDIVNDSSNDDDEIAKESS